MLAEDDQPLAVNKHVAIWVASRLLPIATPITASRTALPFSGVCTPTPGSSPSRCRNEEVAVTVLSLLGLRYRWTYKSARNPTIEPFASSAPWSMRLGVRSLSVEGASPKRDSSVIVAKDECMRVGRSKSARPELLYRLIRSSFKRLLSRSRQRDTCTEG
jgi:hypothetical protein